jgi:hypothetical protein
MKFKLIEDINRGHENVSSNELLDENVQQNFKSNIIRQNTLMDLVDLLS